MRNLAGRARLSIALSAAGFTVLCGVAAATVIPRDMTKQLELIEVQNQNGLAVYGKIVAVEKVMLEDVLPSVPFSVLTVEVKKNLLPGTTPAEELKVYAPGFGEDRLSISPPEEELRVGENVVLFLRGDAGIRLHDADAWKLDSFAESFRTQQNRKGEVVVLGEGKGSAIEENVKFSALEVHVKDAHQLVMASQKKQK